MARALTEIGAKHLPHTSQENYCWTNLLSTIIEWWVGKDVEGSGPGLI
jgi:hypothetical protein